MTTDKFSYDEKLVLNSIGLYKSLKDCISLVLIQSKATQDDEIKELYMWLHKKLKTLSDAEWQEIQKSMPFEVPYDFYDEEAEQEYAEYEEYTDKDYNEFISMIDELKAKSDEMEKKKEQADKEKKSEVE